MIVILLTLCAHHCEHEVFPIFNKTFYLKKIYAEINGVLTLQTHTLTLKSQFLFQLDFTCGPHRIELE